LRRSATFSRKREKEILPGPPVDLIMTDMTTPLPAPATAPRRGIVDADWMNRLRRGAEGFAIPAMALVVSAALFSLFLLALGKSPTQFYQLIWLGGFGTAFSWSNTLLRAAPLMLTALAVAIPARLGLTMIGGEGALVLGGFAAAALAIPMISTVNPWLMHALMLMIAMAIGALWVGIAGVLRHSRGVNETISSLLLSYIAVAIMNFFVEGALRDPADPNKPSTKALSSDLMVGKLPGIDVHWGLAFAVGACLLLYVLMHRTSFGFACRIAGGNARAALAQGLPVGKLIITASMIAGTCAGLAGYFEIAAVHGKANASLATGYGFTGILVAFLARHHPLAIIPVAILFGGIAAAGGIIQRRMGLPDATVLLLQGLTFVVLLASETLYGRFRLFNPVVATERT
jgi:general nucleoside transport system permease protein